MFKTTLSMVRYFLSRTARTVGLLEKLLVGARPHSRLTRGDRMRVQSVMSRRRVPTINRREGGLWMGWAFVVNRNHRTIDWKSSLSSKEVVCTCTEPGFNISPGVLTLTDLCVRAGTSRTGGLETQIGVADSRRKLGVLLLGSTKCRPRSLLPWRGGSLIRYCRTS